MKKRLIALALCLLFVLSACGKTEIRPVENTGSSAAAPQTLSFETTDLDGNAVSSAELFAAHRLTMVNVWTTWCGYCIRELPDLQTLSETYASQDCAVIGLLYDGDTDEKCGEARTLMQDAGASYPVLIPWDGADAQLGIQAFPTTFFVDSEGNIVGEPILGADLEAYTNRLETLLAAD